MDVALPRMVHHGGSLLSCRPVAHAPVVFQCDIRVHRENILEESFRAVRMQSPEKLKARLMIRFEGGSIRAVGGRVASGDEDRTLTWAAPPFCNGPEERGLDYGGPSREWFYLLSHEM